MRPNDKSTFSKVSGHVLTPSSIIKVRKDGYRFENPRKFAIPADIDSPPGHVEAASPDNSKGLRDNRGFHVR